MVAYRKCEFRLIIEWLAILALYSEADSAVCFGFKFVH